MKDCLRFVAGMTAGKGEEVKWYLLEGEGALKAASAVVPDKLVVVFGALRGRLYAIAFNPPSEPEVG